MESLQKTSMAMVLLQVNEPSVLVNTFPSNADVFNLTDENWMKHANPISVWTQYILNGIGIGDLVNHLLFGVGCRPGSNNGISWEKLVSRSYGVVIRRYEK
jgi:hypothetical protein